MTGLEIVNTAFLYSPRWWISGATPLPTSEVKYYLVRLLYLDDRVTAARVRLCLVDLVWFGAYFSDGEFVFWQALVFLARLELTVKWFGFHFKLIGPDVVQLVPLTLQMKQ